MVQRIFYGQPSSLVVHRPAMDLNAREHLMLWPMAILMLVMGVAAPYWMKAINGAVSGLAGSSAGTAAEPAAQTAAATAASRETQ
jgi:NADH-quinone oxidoreductase subunit M